MAREVIGPETVRDATHAGYINPRTKMTDKISNSDCHNCGKRGHWARDCPRRNNQHNMFVGTVEYIDEQEEYGEEMANLVDSVEPMMEEDVRSLLMQEDEELTDTDTLMNYLHSTSSPIWTFNVSSESEDEEEDSDGLGSYLTSSSDFSGDSERSDFVLNLAMQDSLILAIEETERRLSELNEEKANWAYAFNPEESEGDQALLDSIAQVEEWANEEPCDDVSARWLSLRINADWPIDHVFWTEYVHQDEQLEATQFEYDSLEDMSLQTEDGSEEEDEESLFY